MLEQIGRIVRFGELLSKSAVTQFNSTLPVSVVILEDRTSDFTPLTYLLRIGTRQVETRSETPLTVGAHYWGELSRTIDGSLRLSHLIKKPLPLHHPFLVDHASSPIRALQMDELVALASEQKPVARLKEEFLTQLASTQTPQEFQFLTNWILTFASGVVSFLIEDRHRRRTLAQIRQRQQKRQSGLIVDVIEFYAALPNLGPIRGTIEREAEANVLTIDTPYQTTHRFLSQEVGALKLFGRVNIRISQGVTELYPLGDTLLNLQA
ncbi:MAG: hypothetical protein K6347_01280 [Campylobacterales bacterium]